MAESTDKKVIFQQMELIATLINSKDFTRGIQLVERCERVMRALLKQISFIRTEIAGLKSSNFAIIAKFDENQAKTRALEESMSFIDSVIEDEEDNNRSDNYPETILNQEDRDADVIPIF